MWLDFVRHLAHVCIDMQTLSWDVSEMEEVWYYQAEDFLKLEAWSCLKKLHVLQQLQKVVCSRIKGNASQSSNSHFSLVPFLSLQGKRRDLILTGGGGI